MIDIKSQIDNKLIGEQLVDWCSKQTGFIFDRSFCSQERCVRFITDTSKDVFPQIKLKDDIWKSGNCFMYEIYNGTDCFKITATISVKGLNKKYAAELDSLINNGTCPDENSEKIFVKEWIFHDSANNWEKISKALVEFTDLELKYFETELLKWKDNHEYILKEFPTFDLQPVDKETLDDDLLLEGAVRSILTNRYERNIAARKQCIATFGTSCAICGLDFGEVYGPTFSGKIEVHHILPLYKIGKEYEVNPITDLIPVCPNCHMVIHSKPGNDFYTPGEVRSMIESK